jgi:hypothetical protein
MLVEVRRVVCTRCGATFEEHSKIPDLCVSERCWVARTRAEISLYNAYTYGREYLNG